MNGNVQTAQMKIGGTTTISINCMPKSIAKQIRLVSLWSLSVDKHAAIVEMFEKGITPGYIEAEALNRDQMTWAQLFEIGDTLLFVTNLPHRLGQQIFVM